MSRAVSLYFRAILVVYFNIFYHSVQIFLAVILGRPFREGIFRDIYLEICPPHHCRNVPRSLCSHGFWKVCFVASSLLPHKAGVFRNSPVLCQLHRWKAQKKPPNAKGTTASCVSHVLHPLRRQSRPFTLLDSDFLDLLFQAIDHACYKQSRKPFSLTPS